MPVQINEVIIRTTVETQPCGSSDEQKENDTSASVGSDAELIERILEIIQEAKER